jgi:hypothetical protein
LQNKHRRTEEQTTQSLLINLPACVSVTMPASDFASIPPCFQPPEILLSSSGSHALLQV